MVGHRFFDIAAANPDVVALRNERAKPAVNMTYAEMADTVRAVASGLALLGVDRGDRVALLADNQPRWIITDIAIQARGAACVPRGSDTALTELWYILNHSEAVVAFIQNANLLKRLLDNAGPNFLRTVIMLDDSTEAVGHIPGLTVVNFDEVVERGRASAINVDEIIDSLGHEDVAAIVYTSGTTGIPKGVMLTQGNFLHQAENADIGYVPRPGSIQIALLPPWHVYERVAQYFGIIHGSTIVFSDKRYLREDLATHRPQLLPCVPRMWESIYDGIVAKMEKEPPVRQKVFWSFVAIGKTYIRARRRATGMEARPKPATQAERIFASIVAAALKPLYLLGDRLVYSKVRDVTGGRLEAAVSGGGTLAQYLDDFFEVFGIPVLNGYGLTETAPVVSLRSTTHNIRGTVGRPLPHTQIELRDEHGAKVAPGEVGIIHVRGPQVMAGYYRNEEETRKILGSDGMLCTGDLGWVTATGDLVIAGRAKDTIVLSSGENIEPEHIECEAKKSALVSQIVVVGQDQKALGALVVPQFQALAVALGLSADSPMETVAAHPKAEAVVRTDINRVMKQSGGFKPHEFIGRVAILTEPFSEAAGTVTQTLKPKRSVIQRHYADAIETLFQ